MLFSRLITLAPVLCLLTLTACGPDGETLQKVAQAADAPDCATLPRGKECMFRNTPLSLSPQPVRLAGRTFTFRALEKPLAFVDGQGRNWIAPTGTLTDGASIPDVFIPIVGSPDTAEFRLAGAVHDAFCGIGNEEGVNFHSMTWQETHRMFYDSLIVGGTPEVKAKVMFSAVWLGGPRWFARSKADDNHMKAIPDSVLVSYMGEVNKHIQLNNPPIGQLIPYLMGIEARMFLEIEDDSPLVRRNANGLPTTPPPGATRP